MTNQTTATQFVTVINAEKLNGEQGYKFIVTTDGKNSTTDSKIYARRGNAVNKAKAYAEENNLPYFDSANEGLVESAVEEAVEEEVEAIAVDEVTAESIEKAVEATTVKPKAKKAKVSKTITEIKAKYPWATSLCSVDLEDTEEMEDQIRDDDLFVIDVHFPDMTYRLSQWVSGQLQLGKRSFKFVHVECADCRMDRIVKPQDVFQSQRCETCRKAFKKEKR
jgi:ribosomal protein S27E